MKDYTRVVMEQYAQNLNLQNDKQLSSDDLIWFAKLEYRRNGELSANSMHIHIIVSARDKSQSITLNPNINNRNRFNRVQFYLQSEKVFDNMFEFKRKESLLYNHQVKRYGSFSEKLSLYQDTQKRKETIQNLVGIFENPDYGNEQDNTRKRKKTR